MFLRSVVNMWLELCLSAGDRHFSLIPNQKPHHVSTDQSLCYGLQICYCSYFPLNCLKRFFLHLPRLCCSMDLYLRMSRKDPLNFVSMEPALKSSWWAHCYDYISLIEQPQVTFCHRHVFCTVVTMVFRVQIIIRSRLDQSVEENQDLKVRGWADEEKRGLGSGGGGAGVRCMLC